MQKAKEILKIHQIRPRKSLGQNFLLDGNIVDKIIAALDPQKSDTIIEIGTGLGALTLPIAESGARLIAYEKDRKFSQILKEELGRDEAMPRPYYKNVELICSDFLKAKSLKADKLIGNLPYYITAPIIEKLIDNHKRIDEAFITVQKEVAERLVAKPNTKEYSSLTCYVQFYAEVKILFKIKPNSFYPPPEVTSAFTRLKFRKKPSLKVKSEKLLFRIIRGAFNQRRKTLVNSLSSTLEIPKPELTLALEKLSLNPASRAENLSLNDYAHIANNL